MASSTYGSNALKANSSAPSISMVENHMNSSSIGIGNYKGVMLCNRPFGGTTGSSKNAPGNTEGKTQFNCGVVPEATGLNVPISAKEKLVKRPNKDSVLVKHKKWLADLQRTKERLAENYLEEARRKEEEQLKFQEHEKKMRLMTKEIMRENKEEKDSKDITYNSNDAFIAESKSLNLISEEEKAQSKVYKINNNNNNNNNNNTSVSHNNSGAAKSTFKPAWAMTEKAADNQIEEIQNEEENLLLDFANNLDFDKYIGDIEVQSMMDRLRKRIIDLEKDVLLEDIRNADVDARAALRSKLELMGATESALHTEGAKQSSESVAMMAARALLQEEEDMQAIHSTKSVAAMLKLAKDKIEAVRVSVKPGTPPPSEPRVLNEPKIVIHEPNEGARLNGKNEISNLPYMHRNPAI